MATLLCSLWWITLGGLLGWLGSWLFGRSLASPAPVPVERIVDRPVDRIVEKLIDNPVHVARISALESELTAMDGVRNQLTLLQSAPPKVVEKIVEKIVEKPVDRVVEKTVEKQIDNPKHLARIKELESEVAVIAGLRSQISKLEATPPKVVEKVVEKIVEKPVDRVVEKLVEKQIDNPKHLSRIKELETEVAVIAGLRSQISQLQTAPPKIVEKIVEKPVDRVVEKIVEKPVDRVVEKVVEKTIDNPVHLKRIAALEAETAVIAGLRTQISTLQSQPPKIVEKIVEKPVDRIVEKIVEKPVDRIVEKIVEKPVDRIVERVVEKLIDNPVHLTRIAALEAETAVIMGLRTQISALQSQPPTIVEKIVEKPVDRIVEKIVEKPVDRIVEKIVEKPVDRIVEKLVEKQIDNPRHLSRIKELEGEVAVISGLRSQIAQLQSAPPKIVEKIVEKPVDRIVEKVVERPVDRIVEKTVVDTKGIEERDRTIRALQDRIDDLDRKGRDLNLTINERDAAIQRLRHGPALDRAAAKSAGFTVRGDDDLEIIEGIGPKIAGLLRGDGITTFRQLSETTPQRIREILDAAGPSYRIADPGTWPEQAALAAGNRWESLAALQSVLDAGVRTDPKATISALRAKLAKIEEDRARAPKLDMVAAKAAGFSVKGEDDLEVVEGIGPKIAGLLHAAGITTWAKLAETSPADIQVILDKAGPRYRLAKPETWPEQSNLAATNQWRALAALQGVLNAGNA